MTYLPAFCACVYFRYYHGVVQDTTSEEYYVVSFDDGTYCDNLPPTDIVVSHFIHSSLVVILGSVDPSR